MICSKAFEAEKRNARSRTMAAARCSPVSILFTHFGENWIRGSEQVLIDLTGHLDKARYRPVVWCNASLLAERLRQAGVTTYCSEFTTFFGYASPRFSPPRYFSFVAEGMRLVEKHRIGLLHSNGAAPHQWLLPVARLTRLPLVAHLHAPYLRRERFVTLLHQASAIVGVSSSVVADFARDGFPASRLRLIANGVDFNRFHPGPDRGLRAQLGLNDNAILIASVGSLIPRKGFDILIEALARTGLERLHLAIAGEGPERAALEALAAARGLGERVHFLGYQAEIGPLYRAADIAALGSRSEAFGLALAEAGYFNLPAVASAVGGVPDVVAREETGVLVPSEDIGAFAGALRTLAENPAERRRLGKAARQRVTSLFSLSRMVGDFERLYDELLDCSLRSRRGIDPFPYLRLLARRTEGPVTQE